MVYKWLKHTLVLIQALVSGAKTISSSHVFQHMGSYLSITILGNNTTSLPSFGAQLTYQGRTIWDKKKLK